MCLISLRWRGAASPPLRSARCDLLRCVLHLAVAERPVLAPVIHQVDPDVLFADAGLRVNFVGNAPVELLLDVGRAAADPGDLDYDEVRRVLDTKVALLWIDDLVRAVARARPC